MAMETIVLCISVLLVQSIAGRCLNSPSSCGCNSGSISIGCNRGSEIISVTSPSVVVSGANSIVSNANCINSPIVVSGPALASSGGQFITTSIGAYAPSGIRVDNTNELYGELLLSGAVPYLTAIAFEGTFPNSGVASVAYGCGDGEIAITEIIGGAAGATYNNAILPAANYNSCGCGCA